jgi:hypothetical protein
MSKSFINYHLKISRERFEVMNSKQVYLGLTDNLSLHKVSPDFETFMLLLTGVGQNWGWHKRPKYQDINSIKARLVNPQSQLLLLKVNGSIVGYCFVAPINQELDGSVEIENFGFFLSQTNKGYGNYFLPEIFRLLLVKYDGVYLTSRSTNHEKVIKFYTNLGMEVIKTEINPDDLLDDQQLIEPIRRIKSLGKDTQLAST